MNRIYQFAAAAFYVIIFFLLFPWYQYVVDIDAVSYIHVAERIANGEYYYSVNGYWSPLISWILAPFISAGFDAVLSAKYLNGFIGLLTLYSCYALINKFDIHIILKKILPFVLAILLLSYAFYELCADLLQLFIIMLYLNLVLSKDFIQDNYKIFFAGLLGAFSYYAKAYNFPFFLAHFSLVAFLLLKKNKTAPFNKTFIKKIAIAFLTFFFLVAPYLIVLTHKYGSFRISNAGKLNMSWFLSSGISDKRIMVAEPPFGDATSYWDEPTYSQQKIVTPFTSVHFFLAEIKWAFSNAVKFVGLLNLISVFFFVILLGFLIYLYRKKKETVTNEWLLLITTLLYPSGYLLIFIEWRYIWLLPILFLVMAAILITWLFQQQFINKKIFLAATLIVCLSFLQQPLTELKHLKDNYKDVFEIADVFKKNEIKGNFFLNYKSFPPYGKTVVLCYLTQSKLYGPIQLDYNFEELMQAAKQYNINYYLYFYDSPSEKEMFLHSPYAKAGIKVYDQLYPGLIVVQFK